MILSSFGTEDEPRFIGNVIADNVFGNEINIDGHNSASAMMTCFLHIQEVSGTVGISVQFQTCPYDNPDTASHWVDIPGSTMLISNKTANGLSIGSNGTATQQPLKWIRAKITNTGTGSAKVWAGIAMIERRG